MINNKPIRFSNHSLIQCKERGVKIEEVIETIQNSDWTSAKKDRLTCKQNFQYNDNWYDSFYPIKQVAPVFVEKDNEIVVVTVYSFYF